MDLGYSSSRRSSYFSRKSKAATSRIARAASEALEGRLLFASTITIIATGVGSLDSTFAADGGVIAVTDGASGGTAAETLSISALDAASATTNINVTARTGITFNDLGGTATLATGPGHTATFQVGGPTSAAISFNNTSNTLATSGGSLTFTAGTNLTLANLNAAGGNINASAGISGTGNVNAQALTTSATGNVTILTAGGSITQAGQMTGQTINATAFGSITVDSVKGTAVTLSSTTGSVNSAGSSAIGASAQLSIAAETGITVNTLAATLQATNANSGNISITQLASPTQALTTGGSGVVNDAGGGTISISNLGSSITVAAGAPITSANGAISLSATDFTLLNTINSGTATTTLGNSQSGTAIDIGTDNVAGKVSLTQAELNFVTASLLRVGTPTAGSITISQPITVSANVGGNLRLINNGAITESTSPGTGSIAATNLGISSAGPVTLSNVNNIANLSTSTTGALLVNNGTNTLKLPNAGFDGILGVTTTNSSVTLEADNVVPQQTITPGTATVILEPFTTSLNMTVGSASVPGSSFGLTNANLGWITSGITQIGVAADTGNIAITAAINRTPTSTAPSRSQTLSLVTGNNAGNPLVSSTTGAITQTASLSVANLATQSVGGVQLTNAGNDVDALAGNVTGGVTVKNNFRLADAPSVAGTTLTVGTVAGVAGVSTAGSSFVELTTNGALTLNNGLSTGINGAIGLSAGGAVTQAATAAAAITGAFDSLSLIGAGGYTLNNVNNGISDFSGATTNGISYTNAGGLQIGNNDYVDGFGAPAFEGITTASGAIAVTTVAGNLTLFTTDNVSAGGGNSVTLTAGGSGSTLTNSAAVTGSAATLTADDMVLQGGTIDVGAGMVTLNEVTTANVINLGSTADAVSGELDISNVEIHTITSGTTEIGDSADTGPIDVTAPIVVPIPTTLWLRTDGTIGDAASADNITVRTLIAEAGTGISLDTVLGGSFTVPNLAFTNAAGAVRITDSGSGGGMVIGPVGPVTVSTNDGSSSTTTTLTTTGAAGTIKLDDASGGTVLDGSGAVSLNPATGGVAVIIGPAAPGNVLVTDGFTSPAEPFSLVLNSAPTPGETITVVDNTLATSSPIAGTFSNLPEGGTVSAVFSAQVYQLVASYTGGDGNDLVLSNKPIITTTAQPASAVVGASIADAATVTGGTSPTGTVTFKLFSNSTGTGTPLFTDTEPLSPVSAAIALSPGGATESGFTATITTTSPINLSTGDLVTIAGVGVAGYDGSCTVMGATSTSTSTTFTYKAITSGLANSGGGTVTVARALGASKGYTTIATGTDYWVDTYNGDTNNVAVTSGAASEPVIVTPAPATHFGISAPATVPAGGPFNITVTALAAGGSTATGYVGTIHFTSSDGGAALPADYTFSPSDDGVHTFSNGITFVTVGNQTVTATDTITSTITGISSGIHVIPATPTISTSPSPTVVIGTGTKMTVSATLSGGAAETGTITFTLYNPANTVVDIETASVSGNGTYATPTGYLPTTPGTYQWVAIYSGDANNKAVSTANGATPEVAVGTGATVIGTTLYLIGGNGNDFLTVVPTGSSHTGSSGLQTVGVCTGPSGNFNSIFKQTITAVYIDCFNGNDYITFANTITLPTTVIEGAGNDTVSLGQGDNNVTVGNGNDHVTVGDGNNNVIAGSGADVIIAGNGNNVIVDGAGNDSITAGNGNNLLVGGLGQDSLKAGSGRNILIDGTVTIPQTGDTLRNVLNSWIQLGSSPSNVADIRSRINVTYNPTNKNTLSAGSGLDWFWYTNVKDVVNIKSTDLRN